MIRIMVQILAVVAVLTGIVFAGPKIKVTANVVNAGDAMEGQQEKLQAVFTIKNTGDSALVLEKVIPACGCTKVRYDTLIRPGATGKIHAELTISGFGGGPLAKGITVASNAVNESVTHLGVKAYIRPFVDISEPYITINSNFSDKKSICLSSRKKDLSVSGVFFAIEADREHASTWQSTVPLSIKHVWQPLDSTRTDGYRVYRLDLFMPVIDRSLLGEFLIRTNHPDRPEIYLTGTLLK